jgi:lipid-binding SYLF domain-containing protein
MKIKLGLLLLPCLGAATLFAQSEVKRLKKAETVVTELMNAPDKSIPQELLDKASCIVIVPGMKKGAFIFGGKYGRGFANCRKPDGAGWSAPAAVRVEGGSVGLQIGGAETDMIMLVMNERGMRGLLTSKFTLGGDATVAAGPVGRNANADTDATFRAEILTWSRSRGLFGGISLQGATLRPDTDVNRLLYKKLIENKEILTGAAPVPSEANGLVTLLNKYSGRK